jgi:O-antigen/teichoic acid export membrane protein
MAFVLFTKEFRPMEKFDLAMTRPFFRYGIKAYLILIFNFLNYRLDIILVKYFLTVSDVSYYQIAVSIAQRFWYIPNAMSTLLFPTLMAMNKGSSKFTARLCRNNLFLMIPLSILTIFVIHPTVILLFGKEYEAVTYALYSILWGITIFPIYKFLATYFASKKKLGIGIFASATGIVVNVIANIILIPKFGIVGAGIATSISYSVLSIILLLFFRVHTKIPLREILVPNKEDFKEYIKITKKIFQRLHPSTNKNNSSSST